MESSTCQESNVSGLVKTVPLVQALFRDNCVKFFSNLSQRGVIGIKND